MKVILLEETYIVSGGISFSAFALTHAQAGAMIRESSYTGLGSFVGSATGTLLILGLTFRNPNNIALFFPVMLISITVGAIVGNSAEVFISR